MTGVDTGTPGEAFMELKKENPADADTWLVITHRHGSDTKIRICVCWDYVTLLDCLCRWLVYCICQGLGFASCGEPLCRCQGFVTELTSPNR